MDNIQELKYVLEKDHNEGIVTVYKRIDGVLKFYFVFKAENIQNIKWEIKEWLEEKGDTNIYTIKP